MSTSAPEATDPSLEEARAEFEAFLEEMEDELDETIEVLDAAEVLPAGKLSFRPRSFDLVERGMLEMLAGPPERCPMTEDGVVDFLARYFGETAARTIDGCEWRLSEAPDAPAFGLPVVAHPSGLEIAPHHVAERFVDTAQMGTLRKALRGLTGDGPPLKLEAIAPEGAQGSGGSGS